jgi:hypothetical protein
MLVCVTTQFKLSAVTAVSEILQRIYNIPTKALIRNQMKQTPPPHPIYLGLISIQFNIIVTPTPMPPVVFR